MIDFTNIFQLKGLKHKNKGRTNFYECCDLTKKLYLQYIHTRHRFYAICLEKFNAKYLVFSEITATSFFKSFTLFSCKCKWIQNFEFYCALLFLDFQIKDLASAASCASTNVRATYLEFVLGV